MPKGGDPTDNPAALKQAQLSERIFNETDPLRQLLLGQSESFLGGDFDVTQLPQFRALKSGLEGSFKGARSGVIADTPAGGTLTKALVELEAKKAGALSFGTGAIAEKELSKALTLGTGLVQPALSGLGQASFVQGQNLDSARDREAAIFTGIGQGAGAYFGGKN